MAYATKVPGCHAHLGLLDAAAALAASEANKAASPVSLPVADLVSLGSPTPPGARLKTPLTQRDADLAWRRC